ncbi:MAG TPA: DUF393 domain-containing protein [Gemmatales bacterium]|nr:DUF393 domain-containing protein [Gemmatales bacterium]
MSTPASIPVDHTQATVLYDGQCSFCQRSVAILKKFDWLKKLRYQDARQIELLPKTDPPLDHQHLLDEMHLVPPSGHPVYHGFGAFRWMAWRLPLCWSIAPFLYLPGVPWLGNKAYLWVAKHRYQLVPCKDGVCEVPPRVVQPKP